MAEERARLKQSVMSQKMAEMTKLENTLTDQNQVGTWRDRTLTDQNHVGVWHDRTLID